VNQVRITLPMTATAVASAVSGRRPRAAMSVTVAAPIATVTMVIAPVTTVIPPPATAEIKSTCIRGPITVVIAIPVPGPVIIRIPIGRAVRLRIAVIRVTITGRHCTPG
jgi:hypothetical protein